MIDEHLQEEAALYASGAMSAREREEFELLLHGNHELAQLVDELHEAAAITFLAAPPAREVQHSATLKERVLARAQEQAQQLQHEAIVMAGPDALVEWVSPAFTEMCGFALDELRGKELGTLLEGQLTDPAAAQRLREAVHGASPCKETLINYRKNGSPYCVTIEMTPIFKSDGVLRCYVAREREIELP